MWSSSTLSTTLQLASVNNLVVQDLTVYLYCISAFYLQMLGETCNLLPDYWLSSVGYHLFISKSDILTGDFRNTDQY